MTANHGVAPGEKERAVLRLLAGSPPASIADALATDVREVLEWAQLYVDGGREALASEAPAVMSPGQPTEDLTTPSDIKLADRPCVDASDGGAVPAQTRQGGGETPPVTFSAIAGSREDLTRVRSEWQNIVGADLAARTRAPELRPAPPSVADRGSAFWVAEFRHDPGAGGAIVVRVREGLRERGITDVVVEEGYFLEPAARSGGRNTRTATPKNAPASAPARRWESVWWEDAINEHGAFQPTPVPAGAVGAELYKQREGSPRIALIDSGDEGAKKQHPEPGPGEPRDALGHGSSVGELIRLAYRRFREEDADLECYRVFHANAGVARSIDVIVAMLFAMHERFTIVVLPLIATISLPDRYGWDELHNVMASAVARTGGQIDTTPVFACAGGNIAGVPIRLPATLPGAVVVQATDWNNQLASYNSRTPEPGPCVVKALGGEHRRPLGTRGPLGAAATECYGTSFSTALIAGTLVPGS